jgi:hypothetical protein
MKGRSRFFDFAQDDKEKYKQILRLTTPRLKSTPGAPFAQDDKQKQKQKKILRLRSG